MKIEDQHFGLPNCWFKARLEIRVSSGSCYFAVVIGGDGIAIREARSAKSLWFMPYLCLRHCASRGRVCASSTTATLRLVW